MELSGPIRGAGMALLLCLGLVPQLAAQTLHGRVLDAESNQGVPQALVEVLQGGSVIAQSLSDATGAYRLQLSTRRTESYTLRASRIGFATQESLALELSPLEVVEVNLRISPSPVAIDELMVEVGRSNLRHEATYEGLYARRANARPVGQERVVVLGDPELQHVSRVQDVMKLFFFELTRGRTRCVDYYVNGILRDASVLDMVADMIEGLEYYIDGRFAPFGFMGGTCSAGFRYSVVAVWLRRP